MPSRPPAHRPMGWKPAPSKRPEVQDPFYGSAEWKRLRAACIQRDGGRCVARDCKTPDRGHGGRLTADHIVERRKGGPDALTNLRTLCALCDGRRHADKAKSNRQD